MSAEIKRITVAELHEAFKAQGVGAREDVAVKCPICGTVQSLRMLQLVGVGKTADEAERYLGFSCVGRWTGAGPFKKNGPPAVGCDWTLGGLFQLHRLIVVDGLGDPHPYFDIASPEEAQALAAQMAERSPLAAKPLPTPASEAAHHG